MNCYFSRSYKDKSSAGNKAKSDIEQIMLQMKFKNIGNKDRIIKSKPLAFVYNLTSIIKTTVKISKGDNIVIQYPLKKYFTFISKITHMKGGKVIVIIHDLGSFRRKKLTTDKEIQKLNNADYIIAHNKKMQQWLIDNGCRALLGTLNIFDYLSESTAQEKQSNNNEYSITYAGALSPKKNSFLYELENHIRLHKLNLYGNGFDIERLKSKENYNYIGFIPPDKLISEAKGNFGLVWDGHSIDDCAGDFGEYLKINNPHKVSLYIRCHLPIIIWEKAALAEFVEDNKIGISVKSLKELDSVLKEISAEEYMIMRNNTKTLSEKLQNGYFIKKALQKGIDSITKQES